MTKISNEFRRKRLPHSLHKTFDKSLKGSRSAAIKIFCVECVGADTGYAKVVRECTAPCCALYPFRPYQSKSSEEDGAEIDDLDGTDESPSSEDLSAQIEFLENVARTKDNKQTAE